MNNLKQTFVLKLLCFIVTNFCISMVFSQEIGFPAIRNYTVKEYNNAPQIYSAIQNNQGIMYFGVNGGIMEYDGVTWQYFPNDKLATPYDLVIDKEGKIYVAANGDFGYLTTDKKGNTIYQSLMPLLNDTTLKLGAIRSVKLSNKFVYLQTNDAILQYTPSPEKLQILKANTDDSFDGNFVYQDIYYLRTNKKGLMKVENNVLKPALQSEFFKNKNEFKTALPFNATTLFFPTRTEGLFLYQANKDTVPIKFNISNKDFILNNDIYDASVFQKDYFVLGSSDKGALLIDKQGTTLQQYNEKNLLQTNKVYHIMTDTSQNLWFGLSNGISKTEHGQDLSHWDKYAGLDGIVESVIRYNNTIYIATHSKIFFIDKKNQIQEVLNIPLGQNWCLFEMKNVKSLLSGTSKGIYEIKENKATPLFKGSHAHEMYQSVKKPYRVLSTDADFFISFKYENGKWIYEGKWQNIKDNIRGIIEDENGEIWLGTYRNGVIRVTPDYDNITNPKKNRYYNKKDGFISLKNILPFKFKNKIIWGTEKGLYIYNSQTDCFEPFCELGEQFCNGSCDVFSFIEMPDGKVWIAPLENQKADVGVLNPNKTGGYDWIYAPFRRITNMFVVAFYIEPSGIAWVGGSEGLYRYDMSKDTKNYTQKYNCLIRKITVGTDSLIYGGNTSDSNSLYLKNPSNVKAFTNQSDVKYEFNTLKFEFAAPFFDQEEKTLYSYKLTGFDKEWSKWSRQTDKEYTNLREGTYTFQLKAQNVYDIESETSTYQIIIHPPWYRTYWAYFMYVISGCGLMYLIIYFNLKRLKQTNIRLEEIINERTSEIKYQNSTLEQQKEEIQIFNEELTAINEELNNQRNELEATLYSLKEAQRQLVQSEKMASIGILAAGIAHELNNPLNFIHGGVEGIEQYFRENPYQNKSNVEFCIDAIREGVRRAINIISGLNHFSRTGEFISYNINIHVIIDNCLLILQNITKNKVEIIKNYTDKPYILIGNEGKLHQAILNIITNAVQSIDEKGTITIRTLIKGKKIEISFMDTGCGISEENLPKILDPFFTTKGPGKGTGLGLSITYNILKEHDGSIEFESKLGEGTTTKITLPINVTEKCQGTLT